MVALSNVRFGKTNADIRIVQKALIARGHKIPDGATGHFGEQTKAAYRAEQRAQGFTGAAADGIPGCASLTALGRHAGFSVDCTSAGPPTRGGNGRTPGKRRVPSPVPDHRVTFGFFARGPYAWKPDGVGRHTGQDFAADSGTPVVAVRDGRIEWSNGAGGAYGQWIGLHADNGHVYTYCHLSQRQVRAGQKVSAGQQLGEVGSTGNVTGPHLHFEMSKGPSWSYGNVERPNW
ncbi:peptidoglycan DD-metalloendopeptidase family protein [Streptomyces echinatus]|uniref:Murein DD-endopeptidase MepM/ murein hydrolase activator NlpD n=1 Tax=Streptomyces echinatus TaxID=67293 RepID=A0A7W9Q1Y1_9ACTN|nr:peptidoglycan DD-metalloendopeptidase family protein [Streptomyces echinatus]MBB5932090.1 murein DD-endopeptidase MepM/ murein hydrolase activator NlpD [Streptomyces echinatus]